MAVLLPSPLTASQVMITDIVDGIVETKILHVLAVCSEWAGWALLVAAAVWNPSSPGQPWCLLSV